MKVARRLTLALIFGMLVILGANGYFRVRREVALFRSDRVRDHKLVGLSLGAALAAMWRTDGEAAARAMLEQANMREGKVRVRWLEFTDLPETRAALDRVAPGESMTRIIDDAAGHAARYTYVPVAIDNSRAGVLELSESLDGERSYVRTTLVDTALTTALLGLMCAALSAGLGAWFVGRPMQSLADQARRVGRGDFSGRLALRQRDEIGELAAEMNTMCDRLVDANATVAAEVATRIATLEQLRHADRLMTVGKLASGIAHELGTPLNVVAMRAEMIAAGEIGPDDAVAYSRAIMDACDQMTRIVRHLLEFARPRGPDRATEDVRRIVERTIGLLDALAAKSGVTLALQAGPPVVADVDAGQLQQVFTNLVVNAVHAMTQKGAVFIVVEHERTRPPPNVGGGAADYVCVRVRDVGRGIEPDDLPHVFDPFFTTKDIGQGTGLGLSVAYGIVREHEGWMDVRSAVGQGSEFCVYLPARRSE